MSDEPHTIEDATCLACGCLCDDITLRVEGNRIVSAERACEIGRRWLLADRDESQCPEATIEGQATEAEKALERAAEILANSQSPLILGLTWTSIEAQAAAVAIADRIGATIDPSALSGSRPFREAQTRVGQVTASLGEVKARADLVVFWGVDPITTHPRHWERYSVEPRGRFVPEGRAGRFVVVVDSQRTATAAKADQFIKLDPARQLATLSALRAIVRGARLESDRVEEATGLPLEELRRLVERWASSQYGAFFFGESLEGPACVESALALVRDLNQVGDARFVALTLGEPGNSSGAEAVLTWQASAPGSCSFGRGFPRFLPGEATAEASLSRGESDAALIVADDPRPMLSESARQVLDRIPTIVIAPDATQAGRNAIVGLSSSVIGIHSGGIVRRVDGLMLPLRPALTSRFRSDREWLEALQGRLSLEVTRA